MKTPQEHQKEILTQLSNLTKFVDRLDSVIENMDLRKPKENLDELENHILMVQGSKEFVKQAIHAMKEEHGNS